MEIQTRRFLLRDFVEDDRAPFIAYQTDPRNLTFHDPEESALEQAGLLFDLFRKWAAEQPRRNFQLALVLRRAPEVLVGCCGLRGQEQPPGTMELGIELAPDYRGGYAYAVEVGRALLGFGFDTLGLDVITGTTISANSRVNRLAEWFGAEVTGVEPGEAWARARGWSEVDWRITRAVWSVGNADKLPR